MAYTTMEMINLADYADIFPNLTTKNQIWHAVYFRDYPGQFMAAVRQTAADLGDAAPGYISDIKNILTSAFSPGEIQVLMLNDRLEIEWFLLNLFPEWQEWYQRYMIEQELESWIKNTIGYLKALSTEEEKAAYIASVKNLLSSYAPENWHETINRETAAEWALLFLDDPDTIQTAAFDLDNIKNKKIIGLVIVGVIGVAGFSMLLRRK